MSPVYKFSNVGGFLTKNLYTSALAGNSAVQLDKGSMDPIQTITLASASASIDFTGIPQTYRHLQLRGMITLSALGSGDAFFRYNGDTANNYSRHALYGNGTSALVYAEAPTSIQPANYANGTAQPSCFVIDILDYANNNKFKTMRGSCGNELNGSGIVMFNSGIWRSTSAVTSINIYQNVGSFGINSSFALYGINA